MTGQKIVRKYLIHSPYKEAVKSMRYNKPSYTASKFLKSPVISAATIGQITQEVKHECELLCKIAPSPSQFRVKTTNDLLHLNWESMIEELQRTAPVLTAVLKAAAEASSHSKPDSAIVCMVGAILLKSRCKHMCKVQMVISSLLYAGHASKKVSKYNYMV